MLLEACEYKPGCDALFFVGDLVNKGPLSPQVCVGGKWWEWVVVVEEYMQKQQWQNVGCMAGCRVYGMVLCVVDTWCVLQNATHPSCLQHPF